MNLAAIDLNLLVALDALLAESNVTRAAKKVGLSQPAMSNALARLRDLIGDPLLVRARGAMLPTPRAKALQAPIREALAGIERALAPRGFDPRTASRSFTIAAPDSAELLWMGPLQARLAAEAPGVHVAVIPPARGADPGELLASERADFALIGAFPVEPPLRCVELYRERFVLIARRGHPSIRRRVSLAQMCAVPHVLIAPYGTPGSIVDRALAAVGKSRTVAMRVSTFSSAPLVVASTDCVAVVAERIARAFAGWLPIEVHALPLAVPPISIRMVWHARVDQDDAHSWFRGVVAAITSSRASMSRTRPAAS